VSIGSKLCGITLLVIVSTIIFAGSIGQNQINGADAKQQFKAKLKGDNEVPGVTTDAQGKVSLKVKESNIKYKLNITGLADVTMAHIHQGKSGENGQPVVDLLANGNKQKTSNGLFINGSITDSSLIGPLKGMTISELISSMKDGNNYVNVHTQAYPDGEIRGQIKLSGQQNATSGTQNNTDTERDTETSIVTPTAG